MRGPLVPGTSHGSGGYPWDVSGRIRLVVAGLFVRYTRYKASSYRGEGSAYRGRCIALAQQQRFCALAQIIKARTLMTFISEAISRCR